MRLKKVIIKGLSVCVILVGISLLLYPWISDYLFQNRADGIIQAYQNEEETADEVEKEEMRRQAEEYNESLFAAGIVLTDPFRAEAAAEQDRSYFSTLAVNETGVMGTLEIPKINVSLPIYHGTDDSVLKAGVGHLEGSSLPIGGENTHAILTGHSGLNSAKLFTDLNQLTEGDYFFLHVLGETLAYQVTEINVILPEDISRLGIGKGQDKVTLITCTPYGKNTHRLLVTGERTEYTEEVQEEAEEAREEVTEPSLWMKEYRMAVLSGLILVAGIVGAAEGVKRLRRRSGNQPKKKREEHNA